MPDCKLNIKITDQLPEIKRTQAAAQLSNIKFRINFLKQLDIFFKKFKYFAKKNFLCQSYFCFYGYKHKTMFTLCQLNGRFAFSTTGQKNKST